MMSLFSGFFLTIFQYIFQLNLNFSGFWAGCILGLGYSLGELPNSFLKRRLKIKSGCAEKLTNKTKILFLVLDHIDSIIGSICGLYIIYFPDLELVILLFITGSLLHFKINKILLKYSYKKR